MRLYHGTSGAALKTIFKHGIRPRGADNLGNFAHSVPSCPDAVYMTDTYPLYYAVGAIEDHHPKPWDAAILEIETNLLDPDRLNADEDALEQVNRGRDDLPRHWSMEQRTQHYRDSLLVQQWSWIDSLRDMGTCCYLGTIPVEAITRIALVDVVANPYVTHTAMDALVSVMNFKFCAREYRALTRWIFGDDGESDEPETHNLGGRVHQAYRWPPAPSRDGIRVTYFPFDAV